MEWKGGAAPSTWIRYWRQKCSENYSFSHITDILNIIVMLADMSDIQVFQVVFKHFHLCRKI